MTTAKVSEVTNYAVDSGSDATNTMRVGAGIFYSSEIRCIATINDAKKAATLLGANDLETSLMTSSASKKVATAAFSDRQ